jgi:hypothetical protein
MREWWTTHQGSSRRGHGLLRAVAEVVFESQTETTIKLARRWLQDRLNQSTADVLRTLAAQVAPLILVEKTPQTTGRVEHMQRIERQFPQARFLHLLRHPYGQVRSRLERRLKKLASAGQVMDLVEVSHRFGGVDPQMMWHRCNSNILAFLATVQPKQQMRVRGEDLLSDPDRWLREIAIWLNLRSDSGAIEAMRHPERSPFARFGPRNALMGGDENFFRQPTLRPIEPIVQSLDSPLPWRRDGAGFAPRIRELARHFGYS